MGAQRGADISLSAVLAATEGQDAVSAVSSPLALGIQCARHVAAQGCVLEVDTASSACRSASGSAFPRFSARRSIPAQAFPLKKNRCGIEPVSSTCDNEHTAASLGQAEELGIQDAPRDCPLGSSNQTRVCPSAARNDGGIASSERPEETTEGVVRGAEDAGDVLPEDDAGGLSCGQSNRVNCIGDLAESKRQVSPRIVKGPTQAGNAEGLAGRAPTEQIGRFDLARADSVWQGGHVAQVGHLGIAVREHR
jgi:hypothetical protein